MKTEKTTKQEEKTKVVKTLCEDKRCPIHGGLKVRGRIFEGEVTKKFATRLTIELERMIYSRKYERYFKSKIKVHAALPQCMGSQINIGDLVQIQECRPLSKIIHFAVIKKIKSAGQR